MEISCEGNDLNKCLKNSFLEASKTNKVEKVKACLVLGIDHNSIKDEIQMNGAMNAAYYNSVDCLKVFSTRKEIDWNIHNSFGYTAAMMAALRNNVECLRVLSKVKGVDWNTKKVKRKVDPKLLFSRKNLEIAQIDLENKTDGFSANMIAAALDNFESLEIILGVKDVYANLNFQDNDGETVATRAAGSNNVEIFKILSKIRSIDWNIQNKLGLTAPMIAALTNNVEIFEILSKIRSIDWNIQDKEGFTAAMLAAEVGNASILTILSTINGVHWNLKNMVYDGWTVVAFLAYTSQSEFYQRSQRIHMENKLNLNIETDFTPDLNFSGCLKVLSKIESIDWTIKDSVGENIAMIAASTGNIDCLKLLSTRSDVDWNLKNNEGKTVAMLAVMNECCIEYLLGVNEIGKPQFSLP